MNRAVNILGEVDGGVHRKKAYSAYSLQVHTVSVPCTLGDIINGANPGPALGSPEASVVSGWSAILRCRLLSALLYEVGEFPRPRIFRWLGCWGLSCGCCGEYGRIWRCCCLL